MMAVTPAITGLQAETPGVSRWLDFPCDWRRREQSGEYSLFRDAAEGYGQLLPRPAPDEIAAFYDVDYYTHSAEAGADESEGSLRWKILRHLAWRVDRGTEPTNAWWAKTLGDAPRRCLEIGCGNGATLARLQAMGHDVTGVEPDPAAREAARAQGITALDGIAEVLPEALIGQQFDCVLMVHVLEHCLDPVQALRNARALLAPGGVLVIEVPNNACAGIGHFGRNWLFLDVPRHLNFFTAASLRAMAQLAGFSESRFDYLGYVMQFLSPWHREQGQICRAYGDSPAINGFASHLRYFFKTAFVADDAKYCSIRITATLADPP